MTVKIEPRQPKRARTFAGATCLTGLALFGLEVLAGQALVEMGAQAYALSVQQGESASVLARPALAHMVLCHVVGRRPFQVGNPFVCVGQVQRN